MAKPVPPSKLVLARSALAQRWGRRRDLCVYSSFSGKYSDNPRGVDEAMQQLAPEVASVWLSDGSAAVPPPARAVTVYDASYGRALGQARAVVANNLIPYFVHRPGTTYLQTWHGTPLKRLGFDNPRRRDSAQGFRSAVKDYARWDLLLSQNPHSTACFRTAFAYDREVLELGYPRNDVLLSPEAPAIRTAVRTRLGIPDGVTAVLYAPTWRDDTVNDPTLSLPLDLARVQAALGPDVVVLLRLHHWVAAAVTELHGAIDVSDVPDIRDLFLAADALVTDYSSCMFDFAVTGKPIVLFTPDLDHYGQQLRGFYFDVVEQAPGPLCRDTDALVEVLGDLEGSRRPEAYAAFAATYVPWDDGQAGRRVAQRLLEELHSA